MDAKADKYILHGKALFEARDYEQAYEKLSQAIYLLEENDARLWMNPEEMGELYLLRGSALYQDNENEALSDPDIFTQIIEDYEQAISFQPENSLYYRIRGRLYLNCKFGDFKKEAKADFQEAIKANKQDHLALRFMGEILSKEEEYDKAIHYLTLSLQEVEDKEAFMMRGVCYFRKIPADYSAAALDFGKAQEQLPKLEELYIWRAQCFQELGDITSAIQEYNRLIKISPGNAGYLIDRGTMRFEDDPDGAFDDFNRALEIQIHPLALNNRAYYYLQKGDYQSAIADAKTALEVNGDHSIAYATLAEIYAITGDKEEFYHYLDLALKNYYTDIVDVLMEPAFSPYKEESRFLQLIGKAG